MTHEHAHERAPETAREWDEKYGSENIWSGQPNGALVAEVAAWQPGTALDVGCGEGADAVWLARRGWTVTALDISAVAVERAQRAARDAGVSIEWLVRPFGAEPVGRYDLVSAQYPAVPKQPGDVMEHAFLDAVRPGGHLLIVHHVLDEQRPHGFDPADYVLPADLRRVAEPLGWSVLTDEVRERHVSQGAGAEHTRDRVLVLRRPDGGE